MKALRTLLIACGFLAISSVATADQIGYAVDALENLYQVNLTSGNATLIGNTGVFLEGLAISPGGALFGTDAGGVLYSINPTTAAATSIGNTGLGNIEGLDFDGNTLIGSNFDNPTTFYVIDTSTATVTSIVSTNQGQIRALAVFDPTTVFTASDTPSFQSLVSVSLLTGADTVRGQLPDFFAALDFGTDGILYALSSTGGVWEINQSTGAGTLIGSTGDQFWLDLTIPASVPEPTSIALLGLALGGLAALRRRKLH